MLHKTRFLLIFIMVLAVGLATSFFASPQPVAAITTGIDPSLTDAPAGVVTGGTLKEGFQMTYTVTVFNNGDTATSSAFTLKVALPQHVKFNAPSSGTFGACTSDLATPETLTCPGPATLNPGSSASVTITVTLNQQSAGTHTTNFSISGGGDVNTANNAVGVSPNIQGSPDLTLTKQHTGIFFSIGNNESYTFVITNNGSAPSSNSVTVVDQQGATAWPTTLDYVSFSGTGWNCTKAAQLSCSYVTATGIPSFGTSSTLTVNVSPNNTAGAQITNTAQVSDTAEPPGFQANNTASDTVNVTPAPNITVTSMVANPTTFNVGATGQKFDLTVTNSGGDTFAPVTVSGNLPANMTFVATGSGGSGFTCAAAGQTVTCTRNSQMLAGATATFSIPVNVTSAIPNPATYQVSATTTGQGTPNTGSATVPIATVVLSLTKAAYNSPFLIDASGATDQGYIFSVKNTGTGQTSGVITVTDTLPAGLTFLAGGGGTWSCAGTTVGSTTVTCTLASLGAGATDANLKVQVKVAPTVGSSVTNTGANATTNGSPTAVAPDVTTNVNAPDLTITKTHTDPFVALAASSYTITVKNVGSGATVSNFTVTDNLPAGFTYISGTGTNWTCPVASGQTSVTCNFTGTLVATTGQTVLTINVKPQNGGLAGTPNGTCPSTATGFINCAIASSPDESAGASANDKVWDPTNVNAAPAPDVTISQNYTPNPLTAGGAGTLTLTISNVGSVATTGPITVLDNLPTTGGGFTIGTPTSTPAGANCAASTATSVSCSFAGPLVPTASFTITVPITTAPTTPGTYPNTAQATTTGDGNPQNDSNQIDIIVSPAPVPDLSVTKSHTTGFIRNTPNDFLITVNNVGGATTTAALVTIIDNLPANFTYNSGMDDPADLTGLGTWTCPVAPIVGSQVTCTISSNAVLAGGHYKRLKINATATVVGTTYVNSVVIQSTGGGGETNFANNSATDPVPVTAAAAPDLTITMTNSNNFAQGAVSSFTINVSNSGSGPTNAASQIKVTDTLPAGFAYVNSGTNLSGGSGWTCPAETPGLTSVICTYAPGQVLAGQTLNPLVIQVRPSATGSATNTAAVAPVTGESLTTNNSVSNTVNVAGAFDLKITKTHTPSNFALGSAAGTNVYTIAVQNVGSVITPLGQPIVVTDAIDPALGQVSFVSSNFVCTPNPATNTTVTCTLNNQIPPTTTQTITIHADNLSTTPPFPKNFTNTAQVAINGVTENNTTNNIANDPTTITNGPQADLALSKSHADPMQIGQTGTYTLRVTNSGTAPFTGPVTVVDNLPAGLTYSSFTSVGPGTWTCSPGSPITCNLTSTTLNQGATSSVDIIVNVAGPAGNVTNTAQITTGAPGDPNPANDQASDPTNLATLPPVSSTLSTVCTNPKTGLLANGSQQTVVTVNVKNTIGANQIGASVQLNTSGIPVTVSPSNTGTTDSFGNAVFSVSTSTPGTVSFTATVNGITIGPSPCGSAATFASTTGLSITNSTLTASPTSLAADGVAASTVTVHIADNLNASVVGAGVTLTYTTNTGNVTGITPTSGSTATTDASGNAIFSLKSTTNQIVTLTATATLNGQTITLSQHPVVTFGSGGVSSTVVLTFSTNYISIPADNIFTATLTANIKDSSGNGIAGKTVTVAGSPVLAGVTISPASAVTDASGNATFTVRSSTQGGPVTFTATDTTDTLTFPTVQITFTAPGTKPVAAPNATATPTGPNGGPIKGVVIVRLMCIRTGPGFGYSRYNEAIKFGTIVTVLGRTTRVPGIAARDGCIHKGGPIWFFIQLPDSTIAWANANLIRVSTVGYRGLPILPAPPAPGQPGAGQAATTGIAGLPPKK